MMKSSAGGLAMISVGGSDEQWAREGSLMSFWGGLMGTALRVLLEN